MKEIANECTARNEQRRVCSHVILSVQFKCSKLNVWLQIMLSSIKITTSKRNLLFFTF